MPKARQRASPTQSRKRMRGAPEPNSPPRRPPTARRRACRSRSGPSRPCAPASGSARSPAAAPGALRCQPSSPPFQPGPGDCDCHCHWDMLRKDQGAPESALSLRKRTVELGGFAAAARHVVAGVAPAHVAAGLAAALLAAAAFLAAAAHVTAGLAAALLAAAAHVTAGLAAAFLAAAAFLTALAAFLLPFRHSRLLSSFEGHLTLVRVASLSYRALGLVETWVT